MKKLYLGLLFSFPGVVFSDPHYVQALHPYWGDDKSFTKYLEKFEGNVNVEVNKYAGSKDPDLGEDWYIYIYVINEVSPIDFSIDVSCSGASVQTMTVFDRNTGETFREKVEGVTRIDEFIGADPVHKNGPARVKDKRVVWPLDSAGGAQGMWFYSRKPPMKRYYELRKKDGTMISGVINGPSC